MNFDDLTDDQVFDLVYKPRKEIENSLYVDSYVTDKIELITRKFINKKLTKHNVIMFRTYILQMLKDLIVENKKEMFIDEEGNFVLPKDVTVDISFYEGISFVQFVRKQ